MMKLRLLILMLIPLFGTAQSSPEDLGKEVFAAFKSHDLEMLNGLFPNPTELLAETTKQGVVLTKEQEGDFVKNFPLQINWYKSQCAQMLNGELARKIDWANAVYVGTKSIASKAEVEGESGGELDAVDLVLQLKNGNDGYRMLLSKCMQINGRWYLGGGQIKLEREAGQ